MTNENTYICRILRIDLSTNKVTREQLDPKILRQYIGGAGVAIKILYDEVPPGIAYDDPANRLIFAAGPLNGTRAPGSGIVAVVTKGNLTAGGLSSAQANGYFGARMRFAGAEVIIIQGASPRWQYIYIHDGEVEIKTADHLLGLDVNETQQRIKEEVGQKNASVACIGPAAENNVRFSCIGIDYGHFASSGGNGTVMNSKKLKAIAVYGSKPNVTVANLEGLNIARQKTLEANEKSPYARHATVGTLGDFKGALERKSLPVKNLTIHDWPEITNYYGEHWRSEIVDYKRRPCWACPWHHCGDARVKSGPLAGYEGEEPEYEDMNMFGSNVDIMDPPFSMKLSNDNDRMGMDVKECGFVISMSMECFEKGIIGLKETGGLELRWGNKEAVAQLIKDIAYRRGFGNILAEGVMRAAEKIGNGAQDVAVYVGRGNAPHGFDPRNMGVLDKLAYSDTGSFIGSGVGNLAVDSLGECNFFGFGGFDPVVEMLRAVTGWDMTLPELTESGERAEATARAFNIRHGKVADDDAISPRLGEPPLDGAFKGKAARDTFEKNKPAFYKNKGWDKTTSTPLPETLRRLGLENIEKDLWIKVQLHLYSPLPRVLDLSDGTDSLDIEESVIAKTTVRGLFRQLAERYPGFKSVCESKPGDKFSFFTTVVDGSVVLQAEYDKIELQKGSKVILLPPATGG